MAISQYHKRVNAHIFTAHAQKRIFRSFRAKIEPRHSLKRPRFPIRQMCFHYLVTFTALYSMFLCYYVAWPCDVDLWPTNLDSVPYVELLMTETDANFHYPTIIGYWIWSQLRYEALSLFMHIVTWPITAGGDKNGTHFWNPWPQFTYSRCHLHGATTKIKQCYCWK